MRRNDRAERARELAREHPEAAIILSFYADLVGYQDTLLAAAPRQAPGIDSTALASLVPGLLAWLRHAAPDPLAEAAGDLLRQHDISWRDLIERCWRCDPQPAANGDDMRLFVVEAVLQPFAEELASTSTVDSARGGCPVCGRRPVVATLRERGQGASRALICGLCLTEFAASRVMCPACGEVRFDALPVYRADQFAGIRIDACDTCRSYIKTFDLTENGRAVPVVDDLASVSLDLWAQEQGYRRIRPNALRL
jgi:FdhE protein